MHTEHAPYAYSLIWYMNNILTHRHTKLPIYDIQMYVKICVDILKIFTSETNTVLLYPSTYEKHTHFIACILHCR